MTFMVGVLLAIVPGLLTGWLLAAGVGWSMRRDDFTRHATAIPVPPREPIRAMTERAETSPVVVHVHLAGLPQPGPVVGWPQVVDGHVIRELPPARWGN